MKISHHYYIVPGIVDGRKCHDDADRRRRDPRTLESSIVHDHEKGYPCNSHCVTYEVTNV